MRRWLALGVLLVACGGDDTTTPDAGDASTQDVKTVDTSIPDTAPTTCTPVTSIDAGQNQFVPPITPNPTACSDAQIQSLFDACFGDNASKTACDAFRNASANQPCTACMLSNWGVSGAYGALVDAVGVDYANTSGCIAIETGDFSSASCAAKDQAILACEISACTPNCPQAHDKATLAEWLACTAQADLGICKPYVDAACDLSDAGAVFSVCVDHHDFQSYYDAIAQVFCGGYPADAGVSDGAADASWDAPEGD